MTTCDQFFCMRMAPRHRRLNFFREPFSYSKISRTHHYHDNNKNTVLFLMIFFFFFSGI